MSFQYRTNIPSVMILKETEIKYIFNPYVLLPGDILLMNTYEEIFREKMKCQYEHAAIYVGDAYFMEANGAHVVMNHIYSYAFREQNHACVLRLKKYSGKNLSNIARNARKQMGREYANTRELIYARLRKDSDIKDCSNRSFCSRLVAQSYAGEGINVLPNADYCEPDDFLKSDILTIVEDGVVSASKDLLNVVINNQKFREEEEIESPNAEMFKELSGLYEEDIQDLTQFLKVSINKPHLDEQAIDVVKSSDMFKHMVMINKEMPWFMDDKSFLSHFEDVDEGMHFLYSQMNHYDHTILPDYKELHLQLIVIAYYQPHSKLIEFLKDYIADMVDEAITCRKRLAELFELMILTHKEALKAFFDKYGIYAEFEYVDKPTDISFILEEVMKCSSNSNPEDTQII